MEARRAQLAKAIGLDVAEELRRTQWIRLKELLTCFEAYDRLPQGMTV